MCWWNFGGVLVGCVALFCCYSATDSMVFGLYVATKWVLLALGLGGLGRKDSILTALQLKTHPWSRVTRKKFNYPVYFGATMTQARYQSNKDRERRTPQSNRTNRWSIGPIIAPKTWIELTGCSSTVLDPLGAVLVPETGHFGTSETLPSRAGSG